MGTFFLSSAFSLDALNICTSIRAFDKSRASFSADEYPLEQGSFFSLFVEVRSDFWKHASRLIQEMEGFIQRPQRKYVFLSLFFQGVENGNAV